MSSIITGIGLITSLGLDTKETWDAMVKGQSGVNNIESIDTDEMPVKIAGEIKDFNIVNYGFDSEYSKFDRSWQLGLAAAKLAIEDSNIFNTKYSKYRVGVIIGNAAGSVLSAAKALDAYIHKDTINKEVANAIVRQKVSNEISKYFDFCGPSQVVSTGCTSGIDAIGLANLLIERDEIDIAICGGVEASLSNIVISAFAKINALSFRNDDPKKASRPYEKNRDGFVLSEGVGILVLESKKRAKNRKNKIFGEILGYASNSNAFHMTSMPKDGHILADAIKKSLESAKVDYRNVNYINSHGSSTKLNDYSETQAYKKVFKEKAHDIPISSIKSMIGHSLGAIGGIEVCLCAKMLDEQMILPTINLEEADAECDLDYVPNKARKVSNLNIIVSNASGFSGLNSSVVLKKWGSEI